MWYSRGLSLYGKVTVIKCLVVPKVVCVSSLMSIPKEIIMEFTFFLFLYISFPFLTNLRRKNTISQVLINENVNTQAQIGVFSSSLDTAPLNSVPE